MAQYSPEQIEVLRTKPKGSLTPAEFLAVYRADKQAKKKNYRKNQTPDEALYEVFIEDVKASRSSNQFKEAVKRAGLSISHDRAANLFKVFMAKAKREAGMLDLNQPLPIEESKDSDLFEIYRTAPYARQSQQAFMKATRAKGHRITQGRCRLLYLSFSMKEAAGEVEVTNSIDLSEAETDMFKYYCNQDKTSKSPYYLQLTLSSAGYKIKDATALFKKFKQKHLDLFGTPRPTDVLQHTPAILEEAYETYKPFKSTLEVLSRMRLLGYNVHYNEADELHNRLKKEGNVN